MHITDLDNLIQLVAKLPGLGARSSKRVVLHLLKQKEALMYPLAQALVKTAENTRNCEVCGNLDTTSPCSICADPKRDDSVLCVIEEVVDLWAFERGNIFNGKYHVLGGTLSALEGRGPGDLHIDGLVRRASAEDVTEVIIATNATVDGQTTAHYITERLADANVNITRLAHGIPIGGELDYLDDGTLGAALKSRRAV